MAEDGTEVEPTVVFSIRDSLNAAMAKKLPSYEELLPRFVGHYLTTESGIEALCEVEVVIAESDEFARPIIVFGGPAGEATEDQQVLTLTIEVEDAEEFQLLLAAVLKFKGSLDYYGEPKEEFGLVA